MKKSLFLLALNIFLFHQTSFAHDLSGSNVEFVELSSSIGVNNSDDELVATPAKSGYHVEFEIGASYNSGASSGTETYGSQLGASNTTYDFNNLTIENGGDAGPSSGTNWSISGNTLLVTGTASIDASVIETALGNGPLTILGTDPTNFPVIVNEEINSNTAGNGLTIGSDVYNSAVVEIRAPISVNGYLSLYGFDVIIAGNIATNASNENIFIKSSRTSSLYGPHSITTQGGNVIFWSDSDNNGEGRIRINVNCNISSNGGDIIMAGGLDDGSNGGTANDGIPDGYASGMVGTNNGIWLDGTSVSPISINSSGGDIIMKGQSSTSYSFGIRFEYATVSSGSGKINLLGLARGSGSNNIGISLINGVEILSDADITLNGTGSYGSGPDWGIRLFADASISCGGNLDMTAVAGSSSEEGISQDNTGTGFISVDGTTTINTGVNDVDMQRVANDFTGAVTISQARNVLLRDSNAMTLGAISASGDIDIATNTGDLTISGNISTTSTSNNAIVLNAARLEAKGTATGGDIIISGTPSLTYGAGGPVLNYLVARRAAV